MIVALIGWFAFATSIIGVYLNAKKLQACWYVWLVSNVCWMVYALIPLQLALFLMQFVFMCGNIYGMRQWKKLKKDETK